MSDIAELGLRADSKEVRRATDDLNRFNGAAGATEGKAKRATDSINSIGVSAKNLATAVAAGFGVVGISAAFTATSRTIASFEATLSGVRAVTGSTAAEMEAMKKVAIDLGASTKFSASEAAEGMRLLGQAGFDATKIIAAMPSILALAAAGELSIAEAAQIGGVTLTQFGLAADQAGRVADVLAGAANAANTDVRGLGEGMKYVAPLASSLGISLEDTTAALSALSNTGLDSSTAGTALGRMLSELVNPSRIAREQIKELGISMQEINPATVKLTDVVARFGAAGMDAGAAARIFGDEGSRAILNLLKPSAKLTELTKQLQHVGGSAAEAGKVMSNNLSGDIEQFGGAIDSLMLKTGEAGLLGVLRSVTQAATSFVNAIGSGSGFAHVMEASMAALAIATGKLSAALIATASARLADYAAAQRLNKENAQAAVMVAQFARSEAQKSAALVASTEASMANLQVEIEAEAQRRISQISRLGIQESDRRAAILKGELTAVTLANTAAMATNTRNAVIAAEATTAASVAVSGLGVAARAGGAALGLLRGGLALLGGPVGALITGLSLVAMWFATSHDDSEKLATQLPNTTRSLKELADEANRLRSGGPVLSAEQTAGLEEGRKHILQLADAITILAAARDLAAAHGDGISASAQQAEIDKLAQSILEISQQMRAVSVTSSAAANATAAFDKEVAQANESVADANRTRQIELALLREGVSAEEASARAKMQVGNISKQNIADYIASTRALKEYKDALDAFTDSLDQYNTSQIDAESSRIESRGLEKQIALMQTGLSIEQASSVLAQSNLELKLQAAKAAGNEAQAAATQLELDQRRATVMGQLQAAGGQNQMLRDQIALMGPLVSAEDALYQVKLKNIEADRARLLAVGDSSAAALKGAEAEQMQLERHLQTLQELQAFLDKDSFGSLASDIRDAFGSIGDPISGLIDGMQRFSNVSEEAAKQISKIKLDKILSDQEKQTAISQVQLRTNIEQLGAYGDLASAASNFFDKGSKGYKTMQGVSQAFHAAELAATLAELAPKGVSAVLSALAAPFPYNFVAGAAMAAIVAGLGVSVGSVGGGGSYSKPNTGIGAGKGTVLGDSDATSQSIDNSLDALVDLQDKGLFVAQSQLDALRAIQVGINGVGNLLYRTNTGAGGPTPFNTPTSNAGNFGAVSGFVGHANDLLANISLPDKILKQVFGFDFRDFDLGAALLKGILGSTKVKQVDEGLFIKEGQTLGDILAGGLEASYYATIKITKKKLFGLSKSSKTRDEFADLGDELSNQFTDIISGLGDSIIDAAALLGADAQKATDLLNAQTIDIGKISLDGLSSEDVQDKLNSVFSALGDTFAAAVLPGISDFQQTGEGLYETLIRVSSQTVAITDALDKFGLAFGDLAGLDLAHAAQNVIDYAGGIDNLAQSLGDYFKGFFSEQEQIDAERADLVKQLDTLGLVLPSTRAGFRDLVTGLDLTTEAGQHAFALLTSLSDTAADVYSFAEDAAKDALSAMQDAADDQLSALNDAVSSKTSEFNAAVNDYKSGLAAITKALQDQLKGVADARTDIESTILSIRRSNGFDEVGYQSGLVASLRGQIGQGGIDDQIGTVNALTQAIQGRYTAEIAQINEAKSAADSLYSTQQQFAESMRDALKGLKGYVDSLKLGDLSPLTNAARLDEARNQYGRALMGAQRGNDPASIAALQSAASAYLTEARSYNASSEAYTGIFDDVQHALERISGRSVSSVLPPNTGYYDQQIADLQSKAVNELDGLQDVLDSISEQANEQASIQTEALTLSFETQAAGIIDAIAKASAEAASKIADQLADARAQARQIGNENVASLQAVAQTIVASGNSTVDAITRQANPPSTQKVA